jgi:hypothetical protein
MLEGLQPWVGSVGDASDNAAAETVMGLFKNEAVATGSPLRNGALKTEADAIEVVSSVKRLQRFRTDTSAAMKTSSVDHA